MRFTRHLVFVALLAVATTSEKAVLAQTLPPKLPAVVVTSTRTPQSPGQVPFSFVTLDDDALRLTPTATLDGALRSVPGFSLFRRSDSFTANPTAQGVSFRGLGPSGASRSLVLLDGVPLNDPFGGWVAWTKIPREGLDRAELVPGGGATAWGDAALGGVAQFFTLSPRERFAPADSASGSKFPGESAGNNGPAGRAAASFGDFGTRSFEFAAAQPVGRGAVQLLGRAFATDGFSLVAPERRGPVDIAAASRHRWLTARWQQPLGENLEFMATARGYEEQRGNGTPYQRNGSREKFASFALAGEPAKNFAWNAVAYAQDQSFSSTFSAVNATRTAETPASDQFAVPATAFGAAGTGNWKHDGKGQTGAGIDARFVRGETRENFTFSNGGFTRQRIAGGQESVLGVFVVQEQPLAPKLRLTLGARVDAWREADGHRRETDRITGAVLRDDHYENRAGTEFSPSAGLVWQGTSAWRLRAAAQQSFRRPTLNELYRPFRVGSTVTEANPALQTERSTGGELGTDFKHGAFSFGAAAFWNELRDAVGNVTLARGPGTFPIFGTLAAGGVGRQRLNVDRIRVRGLELSARWQANNIFSLNAAALVEEAVVRRATLAPALVGKRLAQVPRQSATLGATWLAFGGVTLTPRVRWTGRQFEDDENTLRLGEVVVADLGASRALTKRLELFLTLENLGNARVETGRSADGVVNTGTPRLFLGGVRGTW